MIEESDFPVIQAWEAETDQLKEKQEPIKRALEYGEKEGTLYVFEETHFNKTRFSDGTFGVWYGALEEETSQLEAFYWLFRNIQSDLVNAEKGKIRKHRRMFRADVRHNKSINLIGSNVHSKGLVDPDDYSYCNNLGKFAVNEKIALFQAPSVRNSGGKCLPVFVRDALMTDQFLYDFYVTFEKDSDEIIIEKSGVREVLSLPEQWRE
jgi:hypothetical protein